MPPSLDLDVGRLTLGAGGERPPFGAAAAMLPQEELQLQLVVIVVVVRAEEAVQECRSSVHCIDLVAYATISGYEHVGVFLL